MEATKVRAVLLKNEQHPSDGKQILISPHISKEELLSLASQELGISAKKIFSDTGLLLNNLSTIADGVTFYVSQGENFQVKSSGAPQKTSKKYVIAVLGAAAVGKSAITLRYVNNKFIRDYDPTIEDYYTKNAIIDGEPTVLSILDTAGMEDYFPLIDDWIDNKDGFILVFSVELPDSLQRLRYFQDKILHRYSQQGNKGPVTIMAANKVDLPNRNVSSEEGRKAAESMGLKYMEVSAATASGVDDLFAEIIRVLRSRRATNKPASKEPWYKKMCSLL
ncbi:unnamed protein product [Blepharisma stoltei]|uniref:KHA domain-containing protein n=1 Tax=Blepharisma stoltei TaxID=1481888 RepID=A0AAU9K0L9_9CILI|nr:unnamed protein product [Blepharisma stoltei]